MKIIHYLKSDNFIYIYLPYILLFTIYLIFNLNGSQPWFWPDEFRQLGHARYFAGGDYISNLSGTPYANFGYGLLIAPIFWFFSAPVHIYKVILVFNAVVASTVYFSLFYILKNLSELNKKNISLISFITALYPAFIVQGIIAWADAFMFSFQTISIALLLYFFKKPNYVRALLFSSSVGILYMLHIRGLVILIATVIFMMFWFSGAKLLRGKIFFVILLILFYYVIIKIINYKLILAGWHGSVMSYASADMLIRFLDWQYIKIFFIRVAGQLWYLTNATYGLFMVGIFYVLDQIFSGLKSNNGGVFKSKKYFILLYLVFVSVAIFFVSTIFYTVPSPLRPDQLIYGRYNESFVPLFLAMGFLAFYFKKSSKYYWAVFLSFIISTIFLLFDKPDVYEVVPLMVSGITALYFVFNNLNFLIFTAINLLFFLILIKLSGRNFYYGLFFIAILFSLSTIIFYSSYKNLNKSYAQANSLIEDLKESGVKDYYYVGGYFCDDNIELSKWMIDYNEHNYDWQLPNINFHTLNKEAIERPLHKYIIASKCWEAPENIEVKLIFRDEFNVQAIWEIVSY